MKRFLWVSICYLLNLHATYSQKKPLDFSAPASWPTINVQELSPDGSTVLYWVSSEISGRTLVAQKTDRSWQMSISGASNAQITGDSKRIVFATAGDSLGLLDIGQDSVRYIEHVSSYKLSSGRESEWLAYQLADEEKTLSLLNMQTGVSKVYAGVEDYFFSPKGRILVIQSLEKQNDPNYRKLTMTDLNDGRNRTIGHAWQPSYFAFDSCEQQIAFLSTVRAGAGRKSELLYYRDGMDSLTSLLDTTLQDLKGMCASDGRDIFFSRNGKDLLFYIEKVEEAYPTTHNGAKVDVYNYKDEEFGFKQRKGPFLSVIHLDQNREFVRLQKVMDNFSPNLNSGVFYSDKYVLFESNYYGSVMEAKWRKSAKPDLYLVSTADGSRQLVTSWTSGGCYGFSPRRNFVVWHDADKRIWFSYNIYSHSIQKISAGIPSALYYEDDHPDAPAVEGLAGWVVEDDEVLIYDRYDIWRVDLKGVKPPVNITLGYGAKNNIRLRYMNFQGSLLPVIGRTSSLVLSAVDLNTKWNGFYRLSQGPLGKLTKLILEPKSYYFPPTYSAVNGLPNCTDQFVPIKASNAELYLLEPMSATEYPNLSVTTDFTHFSALTNLAPQKEYNWYRTELIHWPMFDGKSAEGILYKPEDFDIHKKYPLIFLVYERCSDALNSFWDPELSAADISVPWFVSNGYLVFIPDIYYKPGFPGESAYNSVASAAKHLSKIPWVDSKRIGLQGHSFGGFETNYILTRTSLFAAAVSASGTSNVISAYNQMDARRRMQYYYEERQGRIGATIWAKPGLYIENSPIFAANKVTTPVLIMHNRGDRTVLFHQGEEWYNALNRLGKAAWLLQYDGEDHTISDTQNQLDYSIRLAQFFNHYLKGAPAPVWMTRGVSTMMNDTQRGLELDISAGPATN